MYHAPRGTADLLPQEQSYWRYLEHVAQRLAQRYGYRRIDTPVFETTGIFTRTTGEATDIVEKEMYTFQDRGGDLLSLRPEGTAPICRAYLEHGMHAWPQPVRLYYFCPIFRYDRPQAGRYRQHHQFGVEVLGDGDATVDAEVVALAWGLYQELGLSDLTLQLNSIGDSQCRPAYLEALQGYYRQHTPRLCSDCQARLEHNPLRLLDCKQAGCQPSVQDAPRSIDYLCAPCREHWDQLTGYLDTLGIPYQLNPRLVRGLDYYTRTVFEILPLEEGAQSSLCGGGRYDGLIEQLGGRPTPGVGFATGIERIILNLKRQEVPVPQEPAPQVLVAYVGARCRAEGVKLAAQLRAQGIGAVLAPSGKSLKGQMRHASTMDATYVVILGEEELSRQVAVLRDLGRREQREVPLASLPQELVTLGLG